MACLTGILIDVSSSMRRNFERSSHVTEYAHPVNYVFSLGIGACHCLCCSPTPGCEICKSMLAQGEPGWFFPNAHREEKVLVPWARSIFEVIDNLIKNDVSPDNHVFAIGCGARSGEGIFDIIRTLKQIQNEDKITAAAAQGPATTTHINRIFQILKRSGAGTIDKWAKEEVVRRELTDKMAVLLLNKFETDKSFLKTFVEEFLPSACRDWSENWPGFNFLQGAYASVVTSVYKTATEEDIKKVVNKAETYLLKEKIVGVNEHSIFNVRDASNVLHGCVDEKELSAKRSLELWKSIEPYIYDRKPLYQSVEKAIELFQASSFSGHQKLLFILSDGELSYEQTTDPERIDRVVNELKAASVTVVSCFVGDSTEIKPKRLFSRMGLRWKPGEKFMFSLSSKLPTQSLPRTMFVKRDWTIDYTNNEIHLFLQVNSPDHLREASELAQNVVCCQDALSNMLASVDLDVYINQEVKNYKAKRKQEGETCYAEAAATVLHLSMTRIRGREGGCPDFYTLRDEIVEEFKNENNSDDGVPTIRVLEKMCPRYRLQCKGVGLEGAMQAVTSSRPVVATFRLTEEEWDSFENFYESNPKGILTKEEIDITARPPKTYVIGHAVVLTSFDSKCLRLLNSGGEKWGDMGFFRVQNANVLGLKFIDVYWKEDDLKEEEIIYFKKHGSTVAKKLTELLPSLKRAEYKCPKCSKRSPVMEFTGTLSHAKCPKCGKEISTENAQEGNILALNIYLTSLIR